jgi:GTPase SAR1 family protein
MNTADEIRMLLVGPSASGKTTCLKNILHNHFRGVFNHIYVIAPTIKQPIWASVELQKKDRKSDEATNEQFMRYIEEIKKHGEKGERSLLILDDVGNTQLTRMYSALCCEILRLRHYKCSIVICAQNYKLVPPFVRTNCNKFIFFHNANLDEQRKMRQELGNTFYTRYQQYTAEPYKFIFVDYDKNEMDANNRYTNRIQFSNEFYG